MCYTWLTAYAIKSHVNVKALSKISPTVIQNIGVEDFALIISGDSLSKTLEIMLTLIN